MAHVVTSQDEYNAAIAALNGAWGIIEIRSPRGVWIQVGSEADSATVRAWGSATVRAWGSATVRAWGSATVEASGSATVEAWGSATVHGRHRSKINASKFVAVHLHSKNVSVEGGIVIDVTEVDATAASWCDYHGLQVEDGKAVLYKAVNDLWSTSRGFIYKPGRTVTAPDWRDTDECGGGLHFSPSAAQAKTYNTSATRFVAVAVDLADLRPISNSNVAKAKARSCTVLHEVDINGKPVPVEARDEVPA